jgi:photosystem II stability/assembly factor-like uncharacterized protein
MDAKAVHAKLIGYLRVTVLAVDPVSPATLYAGTTSGLFKTTDGGATWNATGLVNDYIHVLGIAQSDPTILYAGAGERGLFKSVDSGSSWSPINNGLRDVVNTGAQITAFVIDSDNPNILYVGISGYGVYKSGDGGSNWAPFNDGLTNLDVHLLALAPGTAKTLYASSPDGVFKTIEDSAPIAVVTLPLSVKVPD